MIIAGLIGGVFAFNSFISTVESLFPPIATFMRQYTYSLWPNVLPGVADLIEMRYKNIISENVFTDRCAKIGYSKNNSENMYNSMQNLLNVGDYVALWRRQKIDEATLDSYLRKLHMTDTTIKLTKKITEFFPSPADLVRFAVREVYTPAIVEKFGQMEDLPATFVKEAAKAGLQEDQAKNYWASHWNLPSAGQGFEMFQRDIISKEDLQMLLKSLDVMPFWRESLIQMSYNTLTRVDVRRMHAMGILDDEGVYDAYRHTGYSPKNAELMLNFTKAYNAEDTKGITRASLQKAFKVGLITEEKLSEYFASFGYTKETIQYWIDITNYEISIEHIEVVKDDIFEQYRAGSITIDQVRVQLSELDLPAKYVDAEIAKEKFLPSKKLKMPTQKELLTFFQNGIITDKEFATRMRELGYRQEDVTLYQKNISVEKTKTQEGM